MKPGNAGFSIMEIMVALAIGGILTAIAVPNFNEMREGYRLRTATYDTFAALQRARSEAVKRNNNYRFSLVDQTTYRLHDDADNDGVIDAGEAVIQKDIASEVPGTEFYLWDWASPVTFAPDGTVTGGNWWGGWVLVKNTQWDMRWILISRTGRITIS